MKTLKHEYNLEVFPQKQNNIMDTHFVHMIAFYGQSTYISNFLKIPFEKTLRRLVNGHSIRCLKEINRSFCILEK